MRKIRKLGSGTYGSVYLAVGDDSFFSTTASLFAVKAASLACPRSLKSLVDEAKILKDLRDNPYVVRCFGQDVSTEDESGCYNILMEYASGGTLENLIHSFTYEGRIMPDSLVAGYSYMLLKGLSSLHRIGLVHCDIKPGNILVFPNDKGLLRLKLADFGLAKYTWKKGPKGFRGTQYYASPECVEEGIQGTATDIWSLGCTILEMMNGGSCIWKDQESWELLIRTDLSPLGFDFLVRCFQINVDSRWTADQLLQHPFITENIKAIDKSLLMVPPPGFEKKGFAGFGDRWINAHDLFSPPKKCSSAGAPKLPLQIIEENKSRAISTYQLFPSAGYYWTSSFLWSNFCS